MKNECTTRLELAREFCNFAKVVHTNNKDDLKEIHYRIILSRIYYAMYHLCLHHDVGGLADKTGSNMHKAMLEALNASSYTRTTNHFSTLYEARKWADYRLIDKKTASDIEKMGIPSYLINSIQKLIKHEKLS